MLIHNVLNPGFSTRARRDRVALFGGIVDLTEEMLDRDGRRMSPAFIEMMLTTLTSLSDKSLAYVLEKVAWVMDPCSEFFWNLLAALIERLPPGKMNKRLAEALMKKANLSAFECVLLRKIDGVLKVFLTQGDAKEAHGGQWHCSGGLMYANESRIEQTISRLAKSFGGKFKNYEKTGDWFEVDDERGTLLSHIFLVEVDGELDHKFGQWFPIDQLPKPMVPHHARIINSAIRSWLERQRKTAGILHETDSLVVKCSSKGTITIENKLYRCQKMTIRVEDRALSVRSQFGMVRGSGS